MSNVPQKLLQAKKWVMQRLAGLGGANKLAGVAVGRIAVGGKVGYGLRVYASPEGIAWLKDLGLPGLLETPLGNVYVAVLQASQAPRAPGQPQPRQPQQGQPQASDDPYAGWGVKYSGTDLKGAAVKHYGTKTKGLSVKVSGTEGVPPKTAGAREFRPRSGAFGTAFSQFEPEDG